MLLVPLSGKKILKNPPVVTIGLILINCLVFFLFQSGDTSRTIETEKYYFESGLVKIEIPRYLQYLNRTADDAAGIPDLEKLKEERIVEFHWQMQTDRQFMDLLENDEIIKKDDPVYGEWKLLRGNYNQLCSKIVWRTYGFTPGAPSALTMITHMFLHGGLGHLIGNMIFLWISGCMLEAGSNRWIFFITYFFTGIFAVLLFWLFNPGSMVPLVGASGAISGVMGAFAVLFGRKKVRVFYSLGFYFNYVKAPAIMLLPLWIGNEFYHFFFSGDAHVAYLAHIGGLSSGAAISYINKRWINAVKLELFDDPPEEKASLLIEKALSHIEKLELEKGTEILETALGIDPLNTSALTHLFNVRKMQPQTPEFHSVSKKLISHHIATDNTQGALKAYSEYKKTADKTKLSPDIYLKLCAMLIDTGKMQRAEGMLATLMKKKKDLPGLSTAILKLANAYKSGGFRDKHLKCVNVLCRQYPGSNEASLAKKFIGG